jgi:subtilisin family serine protease
MRHAPFSRTVLELVSVLAVAAALFTATGPPAAAAPPPAGTPLAASHGAGETHAITLLTGDIAVLQIAPGGQQSAWIEHPAQSREMPAQIYEQDGEVHVVPAEAAPYLASGVLDPNLFDVTGLVRQGYADDERTTLPLLVQSPNGPRAAAPAGVPSGSRKVRTLDSIGAVSVDADKSRVRTVWNSLRGAHPATVTARGAHLATAGKVWLNGMVKATVQDGAAQIGAPEAWAAGYTGKGVHVAVLDTGYDPTHPDLIGQVSQERNFTPDADPPGETAVDRNGHGTHVAATIAGTGAAEDGRYRGVAPGADLWIGKVLDDNGSAPSDQIIAGMQWAADSGANIISMSLGTEFPSDGTDPLSIAADELSKSTKALFVVAAGNLGPDEQRITAPGAAERALTVGAVDAKDQAASFSSRGPGFGDLAVKPEIVAPGVDVVSARAAGTSEGNLLDEFYTSLSGTSMATPHVAGSAALLAQEHPDWTGAQLKAHLVATSKTLPGEPVTFQGAGRVDAAAAVHDQVTVDAAVLSLGHVRQDGGAVTRQITYANPTGRAVHLRLSADVHGTGSDAKRRPDLSFDHPSLTVPAHGSASAKVTLDAADTADGIYAGQLDADVGPGSQVHSVVYFSLEGPLRTVTVKAVDRSGHPAFGPFDLFNEETGEYDRTFLQGGTASVQVPDGTYTTVTSIQDASFLAPTSTVVGDPQLVVDRDLTLSYDARAGRPVTVRTPRDADLDTWRLMWSRTVGERSLTVSAANGQAGQQLFVIPSTKARQGSFTVSTQVQLVQPMLTMRTSGPGGIRLPDPQFASLEDPFVGTRTLPLVFAGGGTPDEFAAADARGMIALVTPGDLIAQVQAAKAAGVALLLVENPGPFPLDVFRQGLPTYGVTPVTSQQLQQALAADPELRLDLTGVSDSTYAYEAVFPETALPARTDYSVDARSVATVVSDYRQNSTRMNAFEQWIPYVDGLGVGNTMVIRRNAPVVRTDYVSTSGVAWQRFAQPSEFAEEYWTQSTVQRYRPGETEHQLWWGPLVAPGVVPLAGAEQVGAPVSRFRDGIRILMPEYYYGGTRYGFIQNQTGDTADLELRRDGEVVGKSQSTQVQFTVPDERAEYELSLSVHDGSGNFADTSVDTRSTWRFQSARTSDTGAALPLVQLGYDVPANGFNEVPAGTDYPLTITPGYQPGARGPGRFGVSVQVSYDDGTTWVDAPVHPAQGRFRATVPAASGPGFASVRVVATDAAGNRLTQEIVKGWRIGS